MAHYYLYTIYQAHPACQVSAKCFSNRAPLSFTTPQDVPNDAAELREVRAPAQVLSQLEASRAEM